MYMNDHETTNVQAAAMLAREDGALDIPGADEYDEPARPRKHGIVPDFDAGALATGEHPF